MSDAHKPICRARLLFVAWLVSLPMTGCRLFDPMVGADADYERARRQIEEPDVGDSDWERPEGRTAEKTRDATFPMLSKLFRWERAKNRDLAKRLYNEGHADFLSAIKAEGSERRTGYRAAAKKFREAGKYWRGSALEQDALFMEGRSYFFAEDYPKAEDAFGRLIKEYPRTMHLDAVQKHQFEIAQYWLQYDRVSHQNFMVLNFTDNKRPWNDTGGHGMRVYERMRLEDPTGPLADDVTMALAQAHFLNRDFETAADTFEDLRITYPDSPHQFDAHFLELRSCLEIYSGPEYTSEPVERAEKLVKSMFKQFPTQAEEQKEFLNKAYAEVRFRNAERLWFQAEYRRMRGENRSSRIYLDQIVRDYDDTPFSEQAKERQTMLADLPDDPKQHLVWLTKLFPENDPVKPLIDSANGGTVMR